MAKLNGLIKIEGTLDDLTFYKTQDGHLVRTKGGVSGERIAKDPNFQRTRENGAEFGSSASAGKTLRTAVRNLMMNASDNRVTSRITQLMTQIKNFDTDSARGERNVAVGMIDRNAKSLLKGFDFNNKATLGSVLFAPYTVNTETGVLSIASFIPTNDIYYPPGATHLSMKSAFAVVDFENGVSEIEYSPVQNITINGTDIPVSLTPAGTPSGTGTKIFLVLIEFFQEVNGVQYSLKNGSYNVLNIVDVA